MSVSSRNDANVTRLLRQIRIYRVISVVLAIGLVYFGYHYKIGTDTKNQDGAGVPGIDLSAPYAAEVKAIIQPLRYTFVSTLNQPGVSLQIDFKNGFWRLKNIHNFDRRGRVVLADGNSGLCGELAGYTFEQIQSLFDPRYKVRFVRAAESNYFPAPLNVHYVLSIVDTQGHAPENTYILDPSFHRYGPVEQFEDYLFFEYLPDLQFMKRQDSNHTEIINRAVPVLITHNIKMSLMVTTELGRFDPHHFAVAILSTRKNQYMPRTIFKVSRQAGKKVVWEANDLQATVRTLPEYQALRQRVETFFDQLPAH